MHLPERILMIRSKNPNEAIEFMNRNQMLWKTSQNPQLLS